MFQNSKEFEKSLSLVLKAIHSNSEVDDLETWQNGLSDLQFHDVLAYAVNKDLLTGLKSKLGSDDSVSISISSPRLTYDGLKFIEQ